MSVTIECNKGEGAVLGNLFRKYTLMRLPSWRPIAFRIEREGTNILHSSPEILQSMLEFSQDLSELQFTCSEEGDMVQETYAFKGSLKSDDLNGNHIKCLTEGIPLLDLLNDSPLTITVYFRNGYGINDINQNLSFLQEKQIVADNSEIKIIPSIHSEVTKFFYEIEETTLDKENLILHLDNDFGNINEVETLSVVMANIAKRIISVNSQLAQM